MRGAYEAYILVKVRDGRMFVCALNRPRRQQKESGDKFEQILATYDESDLIWN